MGGNPPPSANEPFTGTLMLEILFIFGLIGWMLGMAWEFLSSLQAFPTLLVSFAGVPLVALTYYYETMHCSGLECVGQNRPPVPPERFYWSMRKDQIAWLICWLTPLSIGAWAAAIRYPAEAVFRVGSAVGWVAGAVAIYATGRLITACVVYVRASHWFDRMAPWAVGACRRAMYRFSDNPDFLDSNNPERGEKEKRIY